MPQRSELNVFNSTGEETTIRAEADKTTLTSALPFEVNGALQVTTDANGGHTVSNAVSKFVSIAGDFATFVSEFHLTDANGDAIPTSKISIVQQNAVSYTHLTLPTNREV